MQQNESFNLNPAEPPENCLIKENQTSSNLEAQNSVKRKSKLPSAITILLITIIVCLVSLVGLLIFRNHSKLQQVLLKIQSNMRSLYMEKPWAVYAIVFMVINFIVIMNLGFQATFSVLFCLVIQNYVNSFLILYISNLTADVVIFLAAENLVIPCLFLRVKKNYIFKFIQDESKSNPFKTAFVTRFLFLSNGLKSLILAVLEISAASYFSSALFSNFLYMSFICLVANQIDQISDLQNNNKSWNEQSLSEKITLGFTVVVTIFSVAFMIFLGIWVRRKIKEKKDARKNIKKMVTENEIKNTVKVESDNSLQNELHL